MKAHILDGRALARSLRERLTKEAAGLKNKYGVVPHLAVIQVGEDEGLTVYISSQQRLAENIGIEHRVYKLKSSLKEEEAIELIKKLQDLKADPIEIGKRIKTPFTKPPTEKEWLQKWGKLNVEVSYQLDIEPLTNMKNEKE